MQFDMFENESERIIKELTELKRSLESLRRGAFAQIGAVRKEVEALASHCEVISDEVFARSNAL